MWKKSHLLLVSSFLIVFSACSFLPDEESENATDGTDESDFLASAGLGADSGPGGLTVMTRNLYIGADVALVLSAENPAEIPVRAAQAYQTLISTNFPERAQAIATEIAETQPHLVGIQEAFIIRLQSPGDAAGGGTTPAQNVIFDYLEILMQALEAMGLDYQVAGSVQNMDVELPMLAGTDPLRFDDIRATGFDVMLARGDVEFSRVTEANFQARLVLTNVGVSLPRGYVAVDATVLDRSYRVVTTHLEPFAPPIQTAQAQELIAALDDETLPIILLGDMNSPAPGGGTYQLLLSEGFSDIWTRNKTPHAGAGFTCCQAANLRNPLSLLSARIDLILFRSGAEAGRELGAVFAAVVGEEPQDRTPSGLWPSDHAGVVATMRIPSSIAHNRRHADTPIQPDYASSSSAVGSVH